jgi:hypothetical protein
MQRIALVAALGLRNGVTDIDGARSVEWLRDRV